MPKRMFTLSTWFAFSLLLALLSGSVAGQSEYALREFSLGMTQQEAEAIIGSSYVPGGYTVSWDNEISDHPIVSLQKLSSAQANESEELVLNFGPSPKGSAMYRGYQRRHFSSSVLSIADIESHLTKVFGSPKYRNEWVSRKGDKGPTDSYLPDGYFYTSLNLQWGSATATREQFDSEWKNDLTLPGINMLASITISGNASQWPRVDYEMMLRDIERGREYQRMYSKRLDEQMREIKGRTLDSLTSPVR